MSRSEYPFTDFVDVSPITDESKGSAPGKKPVEAYQSGRLWIPYGARGVFGGQVIAQALCAASRTIKLPLGLHSQHCYFLSPALDMPIIYQVERLRDGKSYATRLVKALQHDKPVFILIASYTLPPIDLPPLKDNTISPFSFTPTRQALSHSLRFAHGNASESNSELPSTAGPGETDALHRPGGVAAKFEIPFPDCIAPYEECEEEEIRWQRFMDEKMGEGSKGRKAVSEYVRERKESPVSIAVARVSGPPEKIAEYGLNKRMLWLRPRLRADEKPSIELVKAMIAYMSDFQYIGVASRSVGLTRISKPRLGMLASLDHSTHFYPIPADFDPSSPILHVMEAAIVDVPSGRGVVRGLIYTQSGVLLAMTSQEGVVRADLGKAERGLVEGRGVGEEDEAKAEVKAKL